jgi:muramoyltetrapeptide carboxypeptidase LdcA involved in peptidoglycan recycling
MIKIPPYLKKGDTIGIVCPSGYMPYEKAATCIEVLQQWGYKVKRVKHWATSSIIFQERMKKGCRICK